jgi:hypothetical protein
MADPKDSNPTPARADPLRHKAMERRVHDHVAQLVDDRRFVIPTSFGPRPISLLQRDIESWDRGLALKELLVEMDRPDFSLQEKLPIGRGFDVRLSRQVLLAFNQTLGHLRFASLPPTRALIEDRSPEPMTAAEVRDAVADLPQQSSRRGGGGVPAPMTLILFSSSGFTEDARQTARSFVEGPPTILIEPNPAGGFDVVGPPGAEDLCDLLDPEADTEQRRRAREAIESRRVDLITGAIALDTISETTRLPLRLVEQEAKAWAKENPEGVRVKTIDGVPMLFRDASLATPASAAGTAGRSGSFLGSAMPRSNPILDRLRLFFGGTGQPERKIAYLAERRAALSRQRDLAYGELGSLEEREGELRNEFKNDESVLARRRITSQLVQLQKDIERRRQVLGVLNQQINIVGTHLHNLEIARQGSTANLPSSEEIAQDAANAEEVLAELQASSELADELSGSMSTLGLTAEEAALYEQLSAEAEGKGMTSSLEEDTEPTGERLLNAQRSRDKEAAAIERPAPAAQEPAAAKTAPAEPARTRPETAEPEAS